MAQPPSQSNLKINMRNIIFATLGVIAIVLLIYYVYTEVGEYYGWSLLFLIVINIYLVYRITIREKLGKKLFDDGDFVDPHTRPGQNINSATDEEQSGSEVFAMYDDEYSVCPECDSKIIPGLDYCESCGEELPSA